MKINKEKRNEFTLCDNQKPPAYFSLSPSKIAFQRETLSQRQNTKSSIGFHADEQKNKRIPLPLGANFPLVKVILQTALIALGSETRHATSTRLATVNDSLAKKCSPIEVRCDTSAFDLQFKKNLNYIDSWILFCAFFSTDSPD